MQKTVIFVMGMSGAGKSVFIKNRFPDHTVLDLLAFQKELWPDHVNPTIDDIWTSYKNLKTEIAKKLQTENIVVVEHTLLRAERRSYYLDGLKEAGAKIVGYFLDLDEEEYIRRNPASIFLYSGSKQIQELPAMEEGFDEIYIIGKNEES